MSLFITESYIRERLDGTFTRIGGAREAVPRSFIPSHNLPYRHGTGEHLTEREAREILQLYVRGTSQGVIAARYAVNISTVHNLVQRKTWKQLPWPVAECIGQLLTP